MQIRILVVDDEQDNCDYLKLILTKEGYEVDDPDGSDQDGRDAQGQPTTTWSSST